MQLKSAKNQVGHLEDYNIEKQSEINISHIRVEHMYLQLSTSTSLFNVKLIQNWEDFQDPAPKHVQGRRHAPGADVPCRRPSVPGRHALCCQFSATESPKKKKHLQKKNKKNTNLKFGNILTPNLGLFLSFQLKLHFCFSSKLQLPEGANKATCGTCMRLLALVHGKDLKHIEI